MKSRCSLLSPKVYSLNSISCPCLRPKSLEAWRTSCAPLLDTELLFLALAGNALETLAFGAGAAGAGAQSAAAAGADAEFADARHQRTAQIRGVVETELMSLFLLLCRVLLGLAEGGQAIAIVCGAGIRAAEFRRSLHKAEAT